MKSQSLFKLTTLCAFVSIALTGCVSSDSNDKSQSNPKVELTTNVDVMKPVTDDNISLKPQVMEVKFPTKKNARKGTLYAGNLYPIVVITAGEKPTKKELEGFLSQDMQLKLLNNISTSKENDLDKMNVSIFRLRNGSIDKLIAYAGIPTESKINQLNKRVKYQGQAFITEYKSGSNTLIHPQNGNDIGKLTLSVNFDEKNPVVEGNITTPTKEQSIVLNGKLEQKGKYIGFIGEAKTGDGFSGKFNGAIMGKNAEDIGGSAALSNKDKDARYAVFGGNDEGKMVDLTK